MALLLVKGLGVEEGVAHEQRVAGKRRDGDAGLRVREEGGEDAGRPGAGGDEEAGAWYCAYVSYALSPVDLQEHSQSCAFPP